MKRLSLAKKGKNPLVCMNCHKQFKDAEERILHARNSHKVHLTAFPCKVCRVTGFSALARLKRHQKLNCLGPNWETTIVENQILKTGECSPCEGTELRDFPTADSKDDHENASSLQESATERVRLSARKRFVNSSETRLQSVPMQSRARSNARLLSPDDAVTSSKHMNGKITRSSLNRCKPHSSHVISLSPAETAEKVGDSSVISPENWEPLTPAARKAMKSRKLSLGINPASAIGNGDFQAPHTADFVVPPNRVEDKTSAKSDSSTEPKYIVEGRVAGPAFARALKLPGKSGKTSRRLAKAVNQNAIASAGSRISPPFANRSELTGAIGKVLPDTKGTRIRRSIRSSDQTVKAIKVMKAEVSYARSSSSSYGSKDLIAATKKDSYPKKVDSESRNASVSSIFRSHSSVRFRIPRCPKIKKQDEITKTTTVFKPPLTNHLQGTSNTLTEEKSVSGHANKSTSKVKVNAEEVQNAAQPNKTDSMDGSDDEQPKVVFNEKPLIRNLNEDWLESHEGSSNTQVAEECDVDGTASADPKSRVVSRKAVFSKRRTMPLKGQKSTKVNNQYLRSRRSVFPQKAGGPCRGSNKVEKDPERQESDSLLSGKPRSKRMSRLQLEIQALIREEEVLNPKGIRPSRKLNAFVRNKALLELQGTIITSEGKYGVSSSETSPYETKPSAEPLENNMDVIKSITAKVVTENTTDLIEVHPTTAVSRKLSEEVPAVHLKVEVASDSRKAKTKIDKSSEEKKSIEPTNESLMGDFAAGTGSSKMRPQKSLQTNKSTEGVSTEVSSDKCENLFLNPPEKSEKSNAITSKNKSGLPSNATNEIYCSPITIEDMKTTEPSTVSKQEIDLRSNDSEGEMTSIALLKEHEEVIRVASPGSVCGVAPSTLKSESVYPKSPTHRSFDSVENVDADGLHVDTSKSSLDHLDVCANSGATNYEQTSSLGESSQALLSEEKTSSGRLALKRLRESLVIHEDVQFNKRAKYSEPDARVEMVSTSPNVNSDSPAETTTLTPVKVSLIDWNNFISGSPRRPRLNRDPTTIHKGDTYEMSQLKSPDSALTGNSANSPPLSTKPGSKIGLLNGPAEESPPSSNAKWAKSEVRSFSPDSRQIHAEKLNSPGTSGLPPISSAEKVNVESNTKNEEFSTSSIDNATGPENPINHDSTSDGLSDAASDNTLPAIRSGEADSMSLATGCGEAKVSQHMKSRPSTVLSCPRCHQSGFATKSELTVHRVNSCRRAASSKYKHKTPKSRLTRFYCPGCADRKTDHRTPEALLAHLSHCGNARRGKSRRGSAVVQSPWPAPLTGPSTTFGCPVCGYMFASASRLEQHRIDENHF